MPNHVHSILVISDPDEPVGADLCVCPSVCPNGRCDQPGEHAGKPGERAGKEGEHAGKEGERAGKPGEHAGKPGEHAGSPLHQVVKWFKTMTTNAYIRGVKTLGWPPFSGKLWQRNYYEHIIRDNESFDRFREYIANNPLQWQFDRENLGRVEACLRVSEKAEKE